MKQPSNEQIERVVTGIRKLAVIARRIAESMSELADTAEDLVALWDDELEDNDSQ